MSKADILRENFFVLKDKYDDRKCGEIDYDPFLLKSLCSNIVIPMLSISFDEGCDMWEYLLKRYSNKTLADDVIYQQLTDNVVEELDYETAFRVFSSREIIADYVFRRDINESHMWCQFFIRDLTIHHQYDLANKLLSLLIENKNGENNPQKNLFDTLHWAISSQESRWKMDSDGIDFLHGWFEKVSSKAMRARLESELLSLIDCVEGDAPRGAMPFSMITESNTFENLMNDRKRGQHNNTIKSSQSREIDKGMKERLEIKKTDSGSKFAEVNESDLANALEELNSLVGLEAVKAEVNSLCNLMRVRKIRIDRKLKNPEMSHHLVFSGNPGTGKTTVARLIGKIYHALGVLSKGHFVETDRSGLVAGYVGQTALKTQEVVNRALGGVLFIDEAYSLSPKYKEDFGAEAIETLLKAMEDHRDDFVVIVAGYNELMAEFIKTNPGLQSRFSKFILFPDYTADELMSIFLTFLEKNNYTLEKNAYPILSCYFQRMYDDRSYTFGNARDVRNLFEKVVEKQAGRIVAMVNPSDDDILEIKTIDFCGIVPV